MASIVSLPLRILRLARRLVVVFILGMCLLVGYWWFSAGNPPGSSVTPGSVSSVPALADEHPSVSSSTEGPGSAPSSPEAATSAFIDNLLATHPEQICAVLNEQLSATCRTTVTGALNSPLGKKALTTLADTSVSQAQIDPQTGNGTLKARVFGFDLGLSVRKQADGTWQVSF